jgi:CRP-like cAMP-binding protein
MPPELLAVDEGRRELDVRVGLGLFASEAQLSHLLSIARPLDVDAGHVLYERSSPATTVFQLMSGEIAMKAPDLPSWRVQAGGTSGFVDLMLGRDHARAAVTTTPSRLLEVDAADYRDYLEDNFAVSHRIMSWLSGELVADTVTRPEAPTLLATHATPKTRSFAKVEIPAVERLMMMSRMSALRGASTQGIANLAQSATEARFGPGEIIAAAGSSPTMVSFLVEGQVELELPTGVRVPRAGRDFLAHVEELAATPRLNTVTAVSPVIVLQIDREELLDRLEEHFDLLMAVFGGIARQQEKLNDVAAASGIAVRTDWK